MDHVAEAVDDGLKSFLRIISYPSYTPKLLHVTQLSGFFPTMSVRMTCFMLNFQICPFSEFGLFFSYTLRLRYTVPPCIWYEYH